MLALAAREGDIVSLNPVHRKGLRGVRPELCADALGERAGWVRKATGERYPNIEIHLLIFAAEVTDNGERRRGGRPALQHDG